MLRISLKTIVGSALVFTFAFALRYINFSHEPVFDELYHVLAGASWWQDGTFAIGQGEYTRASLFTRLTGVVYGMTNGDLDAIRLFCVVIGSLLIVAVYVGVAAITTEREGYVAAFMLAVLPGAIFLSQFIRFYSLHALAVWIASIAVYLLFMTNRRAHAKWLLAGTALLMFSFAAHLQVTTFIALAGLSTWLIVVYAPAVWRWLRQSGTQTRSLVSAVAIVAAIAGIVILQDDFQRLVSRYQFSPLWNENRPLLSCRKRGARCCRPHSCNF